MNIRSFQAKIDSIDFVIKSQFPSYYSFTRNPQVVSFQDFQKGLKDDELAIEITEGKEELYVVVVSSTHKELFLIPDLAEFNKLLNTTNEFLRTPPTAALDIDQFKSNSTKLYNLIMGKIGPQIKGKSIKIFADGNLGLFPFETLLMSSIGSSFKDLDYLILHSNVSYGFSASTEYLGLRKSDSEIAAKVLAVAPEFSSRSNWTTGNIYPHEENLLKRYGLNRLPGAEKEVDFLVEGFGATALRDTLATETNFRNMAGDFQIIHVATHSLSDENSPQNFRLIFSQSSDSINDGILNLNEIYDLGLNADLVVLSACNTGVGRVQRGEGIINLAYGFAYAGCPSIAMTMWPLNDETGSSIIMDFYRFLGEKDSKDEALRKAKLNYLEEVDAIFAHPYYWSNLVIIGDVSQVNLGSPKSNLVLWLIFLLGGIALILSLIKKRQRIYQLFKSTN